MTTAPTHLVVGPARHGVVSFARDLVDSLAADFPSPTVHVEDWTHLDDAPARLTGAGGVHLNFTDRLFGPTPTDAADRVVTLVRRVASTGARVTATLHDVPQPADGGNHRERTSAYRTVCGSLHGVATNSEHERSLLGEGGMFAPADVVVVPLPLRIGAAPDRPAGDGSTSVAVLGFIYPGKGHGDVLAAMADLPPDVGFLAIGECSQGHDDLVGHLADTALRARRPFTVTGFVPDAALTIALQRVSVPVAHHRHVSASGSLNTWITAHRRPLTPVNRYTVEHEERHPGTLRLYPDTDRGLATAIESALADPDSTWLAVDDGATARTDTARLYAEALARWHG